MIQENPLAIFSGKSRSVDAIVYLVHNDAIRKMVVDGRIYYSLVDLMGAFARTDQDPRQYWSDVKKAMVKRYGFGVSENVRRLRLLARDGKMRLTDCGDVITVRRVIMSIPSPLAEPLRMYMAGKSDALLAYREMNVARGSEWAADTTHELIGPQEPTEDGPAFQDWGYGQ